jgi:GT2 family glycosyltransferase
MLDPPDHRMSPWVAWEQRMLAKQYSAMEEGRYSATFRQLYTGNASLRLDHFRQAGGFDPSFRRAEDVELAFRLADLGLEFHFEPAAIGLHYAERSYEAWREAAYTYGRNDVVFARDRGRSWILWFIREAFEKQNRGLRWLSQRCVRSPARRSGSTRLLGPIARSERISRIRPGRELSRYALSAVYAVEYYCGVADELGSPDAFTRLIQQGPT